MTDWTWAHEVYDEHFAPLREFGLELERVDSETYWQLHETHLREYFPPEAHFRAGALKTEERPESHLFMSETELTVSEYLEYLNDPATLAEIDASEALVRVPRGVNGGYFPRKNGRYVVADDWELDDPVVGVSFHDATAYVDWRNARSRGAGERVSYRLPTKSDFLLASGDRLLSYGSAEQLRRAQALLRGDEVEPLG